MKAFMDFIKYWLFPIKEPISPDEAWEQFQKKANKIDLSIPKRSHSFDLSSELVSVMFKNMVDYQNAVRGANRAIESLLPLYEEPYTKRPFSVELDTFFITEKRIYIESNELFQSFLSDCMTFLELFRKMELEPKAENFRLVRVLKPLSLNIQSLFEYFHDLSR